MQLDNNMELKKKVIPKHNDQDEFIGGRKRFLIHHQKV